MAKNLGYKAIRLKAGRFQSSRSFEKHYGKIVGYTLFRGWVIYYTKNKAFGMTRKAWKWFYQGNG